MKEEKFSTTTDHLQEIKRNWLIAVGLKILFCILSLQVILNLAIWKFLLVGFLPLLGRFIVIGFLVPLCVMIWYLYYGYKKVRTCPELKKTVGDSAYFLGFLFTIASIIAAMGDMALTNMQDSTMTYVASRFALAMITTLLGMTYRTYLTEFDYDDEDTANTDSTCDQKPELPSQRDDKQNSNQPQRGSNKQDDEYAVSLVIKAISDDEVFRKLQDTMNHAIHSFNEMATNAVNVKNKLEAAAQVLVGSTGEHLKNSVAQMMDEASKSIIDSASKMATANQELIDKNQKQLEDHMDAQKQLMKNILSEISAAYNDAQSRTAAITEETQTALRAGLNGIAPIFQEAAQKLIQEQQSALAMMEKSTLAQRRSIDVTLDALNTSTQELHTNIENLKTIYKSWNDETRLINTNIRKRSDHLNEAYNKLAISVETMSGTMDTTQNGLAEELHQIESNIAKLKEFTISLNGSVSSFNDVKIKFDGIINALSEAEGKYVSFEKQFGNNLTHAVGLIDKLPQVVSSLNTTAQEFNGCIGYLSRELVKTNKDLADAANHYMTTKDSIKSPKAWWHLW